MFSDQRQGCLRGMKWRQPLPHNEPGYAISVLECWYLEGVIEPVINQNYRLIHLGQVGAEKGIGSTTLEEDVERWLKWQDSFRPLESAPTGSGGIRLIICERPSMEMGMSISQSTYLKIEKEFDLHPATLPSFDTMNGTFGIFIDSLWTDPATIRMVAKLPQKIEIGNSTLSLCHNISTRWTHAFICGQRLLTKSSHDQDYGSQFTQLTNAIIAAPGLWDNPLFLPSILLQNYVYRLQSRSHRINDILTGLETEIGVTFAGAAGYQHERDRWPQDVDPKTTTIDLHSITTQIIFLSSCCRWASDYASHLLKAAQKIEDVTQYSTHRQIRTRDISQDIDYLFNTSEAVQTRYQNFKDRANVQTNVLFNIINQQATILSQRDMQLSFRIAKSGKQDSISMTTFTFLTALFLPGTFVAAMFSMGMFDWQKDDNVDDNSTIRSTHQSYVASNFWIYWVVTLPLTLATMSSWYMWSRYANRKWLKELNDATMLKEE